MKQVNAGGVRRLKRGVRSRAREGGVDGRNKATQQKKQRRVDIKFWPSAAGDGGLVAGGKDRGQRRKVTPLLLGVAAVAIDEGANATRRKKGGGATFSHSDKTATDSDIGGKG